MLHVGLFAVVKVLVSILFVVSLSLIAERVGPRVAGIISGYPMGAAITLFFIAVEIDPHFAARSAIFTASGLAATVAFVGGYLLGLRWAERFSRPAAVLVCVVTGVTAYLAAAWILSRLPANWIEAAAVAIISIGLAAHRFRKLPNVAIEKKIGFRFGVVLLRGAFAGLVILGITTVAEVVGPRWAGLFSAFPSTMLPLLVIIQVTHQPAHVRTIIKNVPRGLQSLLIYVIIVAATYEGWGPAWGTLAGYLGATLYLLAAEYVERNGRNRRLCGSKEANR